MCSATAPLADRPRNEIVLAQFFVAKRRGQLQIPARAKVSALAPEYGRLGGTFFKFAECGNKGFGVLSVYSIAGLRAVLDDGPDVAVLFAFDRGCISPLPCADPVVALSKYG